MQVTTLDYSDYLGRIAIGRISSGRVTSRQRVAVIDRRGEVSERQMGKLYAFDGLGRVEADALDAGHLCALVGLEPIEIGDTVADPGTSEPLPEVRVDEPTLHMTFRVNDSPPAGREGTLLTSRQIGERLQRELRSNVALRVAQGETREQFRVSGRGAHAPGNPHREHAPRGF